MNNDPNTPQPTQPLPPNQAPVNSTSATQAPTNPAPTAHVPDVSTNLTPVAQASAQSNNMAADPNYAATNAAPNTSQAQSETAYRSFTNLKTWGIVMGVLNILSIVSWLGFTLVMVVMMGIASQAPESKGVLTIVPILLLPIVMTGLCIYSAYLAFTFKKCKNDFSILKRHIIILSVISIFTTSVFELVSIIAVVFVFASLLPKYEQDLAASTQPTQPLASTAPNQPIPTVQPDKAATSVQSTPPVVPPIS